MKKITLMIAGLFASCVIAWGQIPVRGLIGEPYLGIDGGWERLENGASDDGWGVGAELNMAAPLGPRTGFGTDLNVRLDYMDVSDADIWNAVGILRAYTLPHTGFTPFLGAGFGWVDFDAFDTTYLPVEAGAQFGVGQLAIVPFFRYSFAFDSAVDDFWSAGANAVYWFTPTTGLTGSFTYTDYDGLGGGPIETGLGARIGLAFGF